MNIKFLYYYDYIYKILSNKFIEDILNNIFKLLYPKVYLNLNILNSFKILNNKTNTLQKIILYDDLVQQNCDLCGHLEIILQYKKNHKYKIILLNNKYKCYCNYKNY